MRPIYKWLVAGFILILTAIFAQQSPAVLYSHGKQGGRGAVLQIAPGPSGGGGILLEQNTNFLLLENGAFILQE